MVLHTTVTGKPIRKNRKVLIIRTTTAPLKKQASKELCYIGRRHSTEVVFALPTQLSWV